MTKAYFKEIDILKGIGIYLVVLGHLNLPLAMSKVIFSFHMPLFFFISGFVFKSKANLEFIKDRFNRILMPFYIFSSITFLLYYILNFPKTALTFKDFLIGTLSGISNDHYLSWNVALWFLPSLFFLNVFFNFMRHLFRNYAEILLLILFLLSLFLIKDRNWTFLPFHMGSALLMVPFFIAGTWLKGNYSKVSKLINKNDWMMIVAIVFILVGILTGDFNSQIPDVRVHIIGDAFFFYVGAFFTILGLLLFCRYIKSRILIWLGLNSLLIMCIHLQLIEVASGIVGFIPLKDSYGIMVTMLIILLCVPFSILFNKYFPIAVGSKK